MISSAPARRMMSTLSSELVTAIARACTLLTTWIWCRPSPPPAPVISTVLARTDLRDAERRAHAGPDRADRERRDLHVEAVRHADRVARRHAGEFGVAAAAALAQHAAVAAEVLPAAEAIAAVAADTVADRSPPARRRDPGATFAPTSTISPAISWPRTRPGCPRNLAARATARRDSRCRRHECAPARRPGRARGRSTSVACSNVRTAEIRERDGFHQGHEFNFLRQGECDGAITPRR